LVIRRKSYYTSHRQSHFHLALYHIFPFPSVSGLVPYCIHYMPPIPISPLVFNAHYIGTSCQAIHHFISHRITFYHSRDFPSHRPCSFWKPLFSPDNISPIFPVLFLSRQREMWGPSLPARFHLYSRDIYSCLSASLVHIVSRISC
jgi:hypothetical protein